MGLILFLVLAGLIVFNFYSFLFAKKVRGEIVNVQRVAPAEAIIGSGKNGIGDDFFSFAVAIRHEKDNEIYTASTEDRQWAIAQQGQCVEAKLFPYPPWNLSSGGTYHNARLLKLYDCKGAGPTN